MNLFDVVGSNESLHEPHLTSVLAWLLDPRQSHGCGTFFLRKFLDLLDNKSELNLSWCSDNLQLGKLDSNSVQVLMEQEVEALLEDGTKKQYIDIVILFGSKYGIKHIIAVENKIYNKSVKESQPSLQINGLLHDLENKLPHCNADTCISYVYLTPQITDGSRKAFGGAQEFKESSKINRIRSMSHIAWREGEEKNIRDLLVTCLQDENIGTVSPIPYETKFIVKSLITYINNGFKLPQTENNNITGWENETIIGLKGLYDYCQKHNGKVYVGFSGFTSKKEKKNITTERMSYIEKKRPYKVALHEPKTNNNWPEKEKFVDWIKDLALQVGYTFENDYPEWGLTKNSYSPNTGL